jgi:hypothetical protein
VDAWQNGDPWREPDPWQEADRWEDGDPWQESLRRSVARRGRSTRRSSRLVKAVAVLALAVAILAVALSAGGPEASPTAATADAQRAASAPPPATARPRSAGWRGCPLAVAPAGYVNPLASAIVKPERIDQGVDYAGVGKLAAIGAGRITYLATDNSGWPGTFIEYRLLAGADAGCYVYYAEGVTPAEGLRVGDTVTAGQLIGTIIPMYPTGIEIGWGAGVRTKAYAKVAGQWSPTADEDNIASAAGKSFSSLITALGGPPGKVEGGESGETSSAP